MFKLFFLLSNIIIFDDTLSHYAQKSIFNYSHCFFTRTILYNGNDRPFLSGGFGGIIYCNDIKSNMNLNNCIFYQCSCTGHGGAIYFRCDNEGTNVELNNICANNCFADWNQFAYFVTHLNSNNKFNFLSVSNCNNICNGYISLSLQRGNIILNNFNSSKNFNIERSTFRIYSPTNFNSNFCTIVDNTVSEYRNLMLEGGLNNILSYYNIINNNNPSSSYGIVTNWIGNFIINNSIFLNNINKLFYVHEGQLNIINCKIYHPIYTLFSTYSTGILLTNNNINQLTNTFEIIHLNTIKCENYNLKKTINSKKKNLFKKIIIIFYSINF